MRRPLYHDTNLYITIESFLLPAKTKESAHSKNERLLNPATTYPTGPFPAKYYQRAEA